MQAQDVPAQGLGKPDGHGIADLLRDIGLGSEEPVLIGEGLEGGRLAQRDGAILLRMAVATVGDAVAAARQGGSGPIPVHASVDIGMPPVAARMARQPESGWPRAPVTAIVRRRPQAL